MLESSSSVIDGLMRGKSVSRMGLRENIWKQTMERWLSEGYPKDAGGKPVNPAIHFDLDWGKAGGFFNTFPIKNFKEIVEENDEWIITRDGNGALLKKMKKLAGTPEHIDFEMTSREIWEKKYRPHLLSLDPERLDTESARLGLERWKNHKKWTYFTGPFIYENMRKSLGDVCMLEGMITDPEWIRDYCKVNTDFYIKHFKALFESAGKPQGIRICDDMGYKQGLFCSPSMLADLVFPFYRELVDFMHSNGISVVLHSCGGIEEALPLILDAGFDALEPLERAAGCDPVRFAEKVGNRIALIGGFDKRIIESGDRDLMKKEAINLLNSMRRLGARYIFSSDHSISNLVSYDNYRYLLDVFRANMYY
ncbi:MAG TPA: uroporphyrinogen decarboxylase family protein [Victivallales bacterium]|nr:uroporphyrinogen decarboxylase family protein [Victivallales bacterium]